ncbi:phospholipase D-like domain-containing protein [Algoriphagus machipongonensis]|uniref:Phospholipase D-like domain-containing protein n=1 Tax=Algoriphagus machipongonensis TaxID=388413 RepID=A3HSL9_9BACT|nr:hypothetical protein [Algoriphagus machipongonensis]EAZ82837.1 hypothetical protein ALPR1_11490 [Algoriphagus machipongonensis]
MSKFLTGDDLIEAIDDIIWDAQSILMIVSPYIKLDEYFKRLFDNHIRKPELHIILIFGKNEQEVKRSMSKDDFDYFKKFPNISIIYVSSLHAKYYGNESRGVITSINLYDFSFKNNIEFGVFSEQSVLDRFKQTADNSAWNECFEIAESHAAIFIRRPVFEHKRSLISKSKNYLGSETLLDETDRFYGYFKKRKSSEKKFIEYPTELASDTIIESKPTREKEDLPVHGFCIRTGVQIKFNPNQPMSKSAWKKWSEFGNEEYPEKFCHRSGKPSNGKTSMKNPVLG